jgi:hypothetical protein
MTEDTKEGSLGEESKKKHRRLHGSERARGPKRVFTATRRAVSQIERQGHEE